MRKKIFVVFNVRSTVELKEFDEKSMLLKQWKTSLVVVTVNDNDKVQRIKK